MKTIHQNIQFRVTKPVTREFLCHICEYRRFSYDSDEINEHLRVAARRLFPNYRHIIIADDVDENEDLSIFPARRPDLIHHAEFQHDPYPAIMIPFA